MSLRRFASLAILFALGVCRAAWPLAPPLAGQADTGQEAKPASGFPEIKLLGKASEPKSISTFGTSPRRVVKAMLKLADVKPGEIVFDLGSGDGRVVILAAEKFNARGVGIELDEKLVTQSRQAVAAKRLDERIKIVHADMFNVDLSPADVVIIYLTPEGLAELRPHLERYLRSGARVVSHDYDIPGWTYAEVGTARGWWLGRTHWLYLYKVP